MTKENSKKKQAKVKKSIFKRLFKISAYSLLSFMVLLIIIFSSLPFIVSSNTLRTFIETKLTIVLKQDVKIQAIDLSWFKGFEITDFVIFDDPAISKNEFVHLKKLKFDISYLKLFLLNIDLAFELDGLNLNILKTKSGITNIEHLVSKLVPKDKKAPVIEKTPVEKKPPKPITKKDDKFVIPDLTDFVFILPLGLTARINIKNIDLSFLDDSTGKKAVVKNLAFNIDIPEIAGSPIKIGFKTGIFIDEKKIADSFLNLSINKLFDNHRNLTLHKTSLLVDGKFPGIKITTRGFLKDKKLINTVNINLPELYAPVKGFLPKNIAKTKISGTINTQISIDGSDHESVILNLAVRGNKISVAEGLLKKGKKKFKTGEISFKLENMAALVLENGNIKNIKGYFSFLSKTKISWEGKVDSALSPSRNIEFKIKPLNVNISEILTLVKPLIPGILPDNLPKDIINDIYKNFSINSNKKKKPVNLTISEIAVNLSPENGKGSVMLDDLVFNLPKIKLKIKIPEKKKTDEKDELEDDPILIDPEKKKLAEKKKYLNINLVDFNYNINRVTISLADLFPENLLLSTGLSLKSLKLSGVVDIELEKLVMPEILLTIDNLKKSENPLAKVSANINLKQNLKIERIAVPELLSVNNINENIDLKIVLPEKTCAKVILNNFSLELFPRLIDLAKTGPLKTNINVNSRIEDIHLISIEPLDADIHGVYGNIQVDDFFKAELRAMAKKLAAKGFSVTGSSEVNLEILTKKIISRFAKNIVLTGKNISGFSIKGRAPNEKELEILTSGKIPKSKDLKFLTSINLKTSLLNSGFILKMEEKSLKKNKSKNNKKRTSIYCFDFNIFYFFFVFLFVFIIFYFTLFIIF